MLLDVLGGGKPIYHIEKRIAEMNCKPFCDRSYIIYVNSEIQNDNELGKLMHDFQCRNAGDMYNKVLAERVGYFKDREKGGFEMCEIMDKIAKREREEATIETRLEDIRNIMSNFDVSAKKAMESLRISEQEQDTYLGLLGLKA